MSAVNHALDRRAYALAEKWRKRVSPEPPGVDLAVMMHIAPVDARRSWWREGYAAGLRDCALDLDTERIKGEAERNG